MKIALSPMSFHQKLFSQRMTQADVPAVAKELGFDAVEFLDLLAVPLPAGRWTALARRVWQSLQQRVPMLPRNPLPARPKQYAPDIAYPLRAAADAAGVKVVSWTLDTDLTAQDGALSTERAYWQRGIATARILGADVLRVTTGGADGDRSTLRTAQNNLRDLVSMAEGLQVAIENHWGLSSEPSLLIALLEAVPGTGCCLDFGNFEHPIRNEAILALVPHTVHIHAKSYAFDSQGNETTLPYPRFMRALSHVDYDGWFVIEYEGHQEPVSGIEQTRSLLTRLRFCQRPRNVPLRTDFSPSGKSRTLWPAPTPPPP